MLIGDFARRARLPISTLRYYDRIGLLKPATVDHLTGYRRYTPDQLPAAAIIAQLRSIGMTPGRIALILHGGAAASRTLAEERRRLREEIEQRQQALVRLDSLRSDPPDHDVQIVDLPMREVAAQPFLLAVTDLETGVTRAIARLRGELRRAGHRPTGPWGATFPLELDERVAGFVFAPLGEPAGAELDTAWLPTTKAAHVEHRGGLVSLPLAYHAALTAIEDAGGHARGPVIEEYPDLSTRSPGHIAAVRIHIPYEQRDSAR
jgi:DNA-binding transcriptional MerR regulator